MVFKVESDRVVRITYRILDSEGRLMEERSPEHSYEYLHGRAQIVGPVERVLEGKTAGFQAEVMVTPTDGYGNYDPSLVADLPRDRFPAKVDVAVGMKFSTQGPSGASMTVRVIEVDDESVTVDGNHPLAGLDLVFDVKILNVREATSEELDAGRVGAESVEDDLMSDGDTGSGTVH